MTATIAYIALAAVLVVAAAVAHELTHVAVARLIGGRTRIAWVRRGDAWWTATWIVEYAVPKDTPVWQERLIGLAPLLVGLAAAIAYVAITGWPELSMLTIVATAAWAMFTLSGGPSDYKVGA